MRSLFGFLLLLTCAAFAQQDSSCTGTTIDESASLGNALKAACLSPEDIAQSPSKVDSQITSFAVLNTSYEFVIAYYERQENSDVLAAPLHVLRFVRKPKRWMQADLPGSNGSSGLMPDAACEGSAVAVHRAGGFLYVGLHLNPSAECTLVLDGKLDFKQILSGWYVAGFQNGKIIYEHSTTHFAATHPLVVSLYDPVGAKDTQLYPPESDSYRSEFIDQLQHIMGVDRCTGENCASDPERFETDLSESASNDRTNSFAFIAQYSPVGFVRADEVDSPELNKKIVYVYRITRDSVEHAEFPADEMKSRYGTENLNDLLAWNTLMHVLAR
ncbi:MAG TPA: hypothetical protein VFU50_10885 [Terriglobales bacterium]|nr:hypothetical protein [Terriglobales bacterium]